MQVRDVMTRKVVTVGPDTSPKYAAEVMAGRRDLLRTLVRPDAEIRTDVLRLVEGYTGDLGAWDVTVTEGMTTIRRTRGLPQVAAEVEERALRALATTVGGVVGVRVFTPGAADRPVDASA